MINHGFGVHLAPLSQANLMLYREWRNDERIYKWCRQTGLISELQQERWYAAQDADPTIQMFEIQIEDGTPVGVCGLTSIDLVCRRAEFSVYVAPIQQGNGYGQMALKTLINHGFLTLGLNCIWGETFEGNPAAQIFEQLDFTHEGTRREFYYKDGKFLNAHLYSILREEWLA